MKIEMVIFLNFIPKVLLVKLFVLVFYLDILLSNPNKGTYYISGA